MGNDMGLILGIGVLAVGAWCVFMGPCKKHLEQLGIGGSSSFEQRVKNASDPNFIRQLNNINKGLESGGLSQSQANMYAKHLGQQYNTNYTRRGYRY